MWNRYAETLPRERLASLQLERLPGGLPRSEGKAARHRQTSALIDVLERPLHRG
jgi:hypothetical protein